MRSIHIVWILIGSTAALADDGVHLLPPEAVLTRAPQQFLLHRKVAGEIGSQISSGATWSSNRPDVATVADGLVSPVSPGEAIIEALTPDGSRTTARVTVLAADPDAAPSLRNDILPIFAKLGCNSGACHGALAGKGGFRLSLRGYDPENDYYQIVQQDSGRRVEFSEPAASLLLMKPTGTVPHKGGLKFKVDSPAYRLIGDWIARGAPAPSADETRVESLRIWPERSVHAPGDRQQFVVQAVYSDGRLEDVTHQVKWQSTNDATCLVDDQGIASAVGPGEGAVIAWYASKIAIGRVTIPYPASTMGRADARPPRNFIDEQIDAQLTRLKLPASAPCTDAEFLRRSTIATIGRLPTPDEVRKFLADPSPDRRDAWIDALLQRPEYVDYWTYKWSDVLMLSGNRLRPAALQAYYKQIRRRVEDGTPWDQFVREIITSTGDSVENGLTNFYALSQSPEEMIENACQAFLGLSLNCAKCHDHPLEKWTNDQYYAAANLFARVRAKGWGGESRDGDGLRTLYVASSGDLVQPRTGKPQPPTPLDGAPLRIDEPGDRRIPFADWLVAPENPYFARSITNRVWANFFQIGLVEGVDDLRASNPAGNEELLSASARYLVERKFDLRALMKAILQSNAFQRSSVALPGNRSETRFYSRFYPRRMMAEVLHDAIVQVTEVPTRFEWIEFPGNDRQKTDLYPEGTRAIQLYDSAVQNYFLQAFGRNPRRIVCECERTDQPTLVQALHLSNGTTLNDKLKTPANRVDRLIRLRHAGMADASLIDECYLGCLARYPSEKERQQLAEILPRPGDPDERTVIEDLLWGLLSSREFLFNH